MATVSKSARVNLDSEPSIQEIVVEADSTKAARSNYYKKCDRPVNKIHIISSLIIFYNA
ncbi:hypothetical protein [Gloeocapsa sp. PCC 7428]|uniref:hypothetical protein n=1 Tax=Gloeocapsa sp. PCC 7428 TaxID=1173026 RepID=UPI0002D7B9F3|nr:hypothetical protein [Gloeocapsa sp. PCC 7428]